MSCSSWLVEVWTPRPLFAGKFGEPAFDLVEGNREDHVGWQAQVPLGVGSCCTGLKRARMLGNQYPTTLLR